MAKKLKIKGTVHQKMKILSSFTHPQVVPTCMNVFFLNTKEDFGRMWEKEQFWGTIDFHSILSPTMEVNDAQTVWTFIQVELLEGEQMMTEFSFLGALSF